MTLIKYLFLSFFFFLSFDLSASALPQFPHPKTEEEALFIRRIVDFWEDGEKALVKNQIEEFICHFPETIYKEELLSVLAHLCLEEKEYADAADHYASITSASLQEETLFSYLQALEQLQDFPAILKAAQTFKDTFIEKDVQKHQALIRMQAVATLRLGNTEPSLEKKARYRKTAKQLFSSLLHTDEEPKIIEDLSSLYAEEKAYEKAAELLIEAAEKFPQKKEHLLYEAALFQLEFEPNLAIDTFSQIYHMQGAKKSAAAYNKMLLLFEQKKYEEMLLVKESLFAHLEKKHQDKLHFFLGKSYFYVEDYKRAIDHLAHFAGQDLETLEERENAYFTLLHAAKNLEDINLYTKYLTEFSKTLPSSSLLFEAYFHRADMYRNLKKTAPAKNDYEYLLQQPLPEELLQKTLYAYAHLLYKEKDFSAAKNALASLLEKPNPKPQAWKLFANAAIFAERKGRIDAKELLSSIQKVLSANTCLSSAEKRTYIYYLAKAHFSLEQYEECIAEAIRLTDQENSSLTSAAYLLLAESYLQGLKNDALYCKYAEKALHSSLSKESRSQLELGLFNVYLKRFEETNDQETLLTARNHLYGAYLSGAKLQEQNLLWLVDTYLEDVHQIIEQKLHLIDEEEKLFAKNALSILEHLDLAALDASWKEEKWIDKALIYGYLGEQKTKESLLEQLIENIDESSHFLGSTYLHLADAKRDQKNYVQAKDLYEKAKSCLITPKERTYCKLEQAKMSIKHAALSVENAQKTPLKEAIIELKTLILQKNLQQEPLHLDAAILYIDVITSPVQGIKKEEKTLRLVQKTIDYFLSEKDVLGQEYQLARTRFPEKESIFLTYMDLFDLIAYVSKAKLAHLKGSPEKTAHIANALELVEELSLHTPSTFFVETLSNLRKTLSDLQ